MKRTAEQIFRAGNWAGIVNRMLIEQGAMVRIGESTGVVGSYDMAIDTAAKALIAELGFEVANNTEVKDEH